MKIIHVNAKAVDKVVNWLDKIYPEITATQGKIHDYLCMTFGFYTPGEVKVSMNDYIDKVLTGFPEEFFEISLTPAEDHLFKICDEDEKKVLP